jgi:hypothetical protein
MDNNRQQPFTSHSPPSIHPHLQFPHQLQLILRLTRIPYHQIQWSQCKRSFILRFEINCAFPKLDTDPWDICIWSNVFYSLSVFSDRAGNQIDVYGFFLDNDYYNVNSWVWGI